MTQHPNFESVQETLNHIHFQMDLLKLVNMPVELSGPSVMTSKEPTVEAEAVINELRTTVAKLHSK
jgi:hypothetical protein